MSRASTRSWPSSSTRSTVSEPRRARARLRRPRQEDAERGALVGRALDGHVAARLLHDAQDGREPEPRALPARLGREERLEDSRAGLLVEAHARVADGEADVGPGPRPDAGV